MVLAVQQKQYNHATSASIHNTVQCLAWSLDTVAPKLVKRGLIAQLLLGGVIMLTACRYHSHIHFKVERKDKFTVLKRAMERRRTV